MKPANCLSKQSPKKNKRVSMWTIIHNFFSCIIVILNNFCCECNGQKD